MALNGSQLAQTLQNVMTGQTEPAEAHNDFTGALDDYIIENCKLKGTYTGLLSNGSVDPNNGEVVFDVLSLGISGSGLKSGASDGLSGWLSALSGELSKLSFGGVSGNVTAGALTNIMITANIDMGSKPENKDDAMTIVGNDLVDSILSGVPTPLSVVATSSAGGTGIITWSAIL